MQVYGFLVTASNGIPVFSRIAEKTPFLGGIRGKELITGFLSAMNLFLEELTQRRKKPMNLNVQVQDFAFTMRSCDIKSEYRPRPQKILFILLHSAEDFDASKGLLAILMGRFLSTYNSTLLLDLIENGEVISSEEVIEPSFCALYDEIVRNFHVKSTKLRTDLEFML